MSRLPEVSRAAGAWIGFGLLSFFATWGVFAQEPQSDDQPDLAEAVGISDQVVDFDQPLQGLLQSYCSDCHADGADEGGFRLEDLGTDLTDAATFARWEQLHDRVNAREMPPPDSEQPSQDERQSWIDALSRPLSRVHSATKSTVLRRLNRREYQNTMNDLFGTHLDLERMLPEDARSHEFDNVGEALGLSMVHMQRYIDAARLVIETAVDNRIDQPEPERLVAWYKDIREAETHVGKVWKQLDDGYMVRFSAGGYPSGMLRGSGVRQAGRYRVTVTGYAYQSNEPIVFSIGGASFQRGSEKPIYGFYEVPPDEPTTIEFETWIEPKYMIAIEPYGISDPERYKRKSVDDYEGPGLAIGEVTVEGPLRDQYPLPGHRLIYDGLVRTEVMPKNPRDRTRSWYQPKFRIETDDPVGAATVSIRRVAEKAMRRPIQAEDVVPFVDLFAQQLRQGDSFDQALTTAVTAILSSPRFLFLQESPERLDDYALAARLSYLFHRTAPDDELLRLASTGSLGNETMLKRQTERLIDDERFERFLIDFCDSWLDLREIDFTAPDQKLFPEFDPFLRYSMPRETRAFVREMIEANLPIRNLIESDFAMINSRLAEHYGLSPVDGAEIRKVLLPAESVRGGLLSQAAILKVTANGTNTSPVTRGAWVMERIEGITPPPPPPGVPGVEPDIRGATTLRQMLDQHRNSDNCRACHRKIDPPGFALECFNPIGGFRDRYRSLGMGDRVETKVHRRNVAYRLGPVVDASGEFSDGDTFQDFLEFRRRLARQKQMIAKTFVTRFLTFATGREMGFSDRQSIDQIVSSAAASEYQTADLIHAAIASEIFRTK